MNKKIVKPPSSHPSGNYPKSKAVSRFKLFFGGDKLKSRKREKGTEPAEINQIMAGILDHTPIMAVYLDLQFNFLWVNQSYADACKHEPSFFFGKNHFDLYPHKENQEIFKQVVDTGEPFYVEAKPFEFPDQPELGITFWDWSLIPAKDVDEKVVGLVFTLVEVTDRIRVEVALKKSESQYRELVQNTNSAIIRWKVDGTLVFINEYAQKFFGYSEDEVLGKNVSIFVPQEDSLGKDLTELVKDIVSNPEQYKNNVNENIRSDGSRVWMAWTNKPVLDENGNVTEILAVGTDITALKEAEEELRSLAHFPGENPNPVLRCTVGGDILYANAPARNWLENLEWKSGGLLPDAILNLIHEVWKKIGPIDTEITSSVGLTFKVVAIRPSGEEYVNLYGIDVSDRKRAEIALQIANSDLEKKVKERTAELERRNEELQEFAYIASHDLQEPLRKIKLFSDMVEKELKELLSDRGNDYLQRMSNAADRMQKLIKALLSYSRISSKIGPFERVDLKPIVEDVANDLLPEDGNITSVIEITDMPQIEADPVQMHQLFQNLLSNAIHYHKEGQALKVKISSRIVESCDRPKKKVYELIVEDNGIGFDMVYIDKIFMPFERLNTDSRYKGTGMGLAICRKIVERHSGKITAHSFPGKGSKFTVTLPMRQTNESE